MNDCVRALLLEQIKGISDEISNLGCRLKDHPAACSASASYLCMITARVDAMRGLLNAQDWE